MLLLAIESSALVASIAIMSDNTLLGEYTTNFKKTHSQTLLPMMNELVQMTGISMEDLDAYQKEPKHLEFGAFISQVRESRACIDFQI